MNFEKIQKIALFLFSLFLIFSAIVLLIGGYATNPLVSIVVFVVFIYIAYYIFLKTFFED